MFNFFIETKAQSDIQALQANLTTALEELAKITQRPFKGILFLCPFITPLMR